MDIKCDFTDMDAIFEQGYDNVVKKLEEIGKDAVEVAKRTGNYQDVTGNLRRSNDYKASRSGLVLYNKADYASEVEARGRIVLSSAILYAEKKIKEDFK